MMHNPHPVRPARAAIAAVLALTATPLLAQDIAPLSPAMPQPQAMPAAPAPEASIPVQAAPSMAQPSAAPLPGEPVQLAAPLAPPAVSAVPVTAIAPMAPAPAPAAPRTSRAERQPAPAPALREPAAPAEAAPVAAPVPEPVVGTAAAARPVAPALSGADTLAAQNAATTDTGSGNGDLWGWMAALLAALGVGGGAIALRRGRTAGSAPAVAPAPWAAPLTGATAARAQERPLPTGGSTDQRRLDYLIAQRPSRDNPFLTRPNRKRRAVFLLRSGYPMQSAA